MARDFNEIMAVDLKEYKKDVHILNMVDMATRFSKSCITRSKEPTEIVEKIMEIWLRTCLGPPMKFLCYSGGEFANNSFLEMCENVNIQVMHTAAYSPFINGLCESNHAIVDEMVAKLRSEQPELSSNVALPWAVNAKKLFSIYRGLQSLSAGGWTES